MCLGTSRIKTFFSLTNSTVGKKTILFGGGGFVCFLVKPIPTKHLNHPVDRNNKNRFF